jgi:hypothetical protein
MNRLITAVALSSALLFIGCGEDGTDNNITNPEGILGDYNETAGDVYDTVDTASDTYEENNGDIILGDYDTTTTDSGYTNPNLGDRIDDNGDIVTENSPINLGNYDIESFKSWYSMTCEKNFNEKSYNSTTGAYNGKIDCSHKRLDDIDLNYISVFTSVREIDLSYNDLRYVDLKPLGSMKVINILRLNNNKLDMSADDFSPLKNLERLDELWINNNNLNFTKEDRIELYRNLPPHHKDDTVKFKFHK